MNGNFWDRVLDLLERQDIPRKEFAAQVGISYSSIHNGVALGSVPSADIVQKRRTVPLPQKQGHNQRDRKAFPRPPLIPPRLDCKDCKKLARQKKSAAAAADFFLLLSVIGVWPVLALVVLFYYVVRKRLRAGIYRERIERHFANFFQDGGVVDGLLRVASPGKGSVAAD